MSANISAGEARNPLDRPQLKWLLATLGVVVIVAIVFLFSESMKKSASVPQRTVSDNDTDRMPAQDAIQKRLENLAAEDAENLVTRPTQDEMMKRLEALDEE